jgi:hypothetical protein
VVVVVVIVIIVVVVVVIIIIIIIAALSYRYTHFLPALEATVKSCFTCHLRNFILCR